ncbi:putative benzoate 4-monooxygenase cytochrome p450 [Phaeomoniella chlamydospora]|uniref:Putative benzoate 4-monooxygenase cytochrome p450 n=1 Tax=Phaeomoniella chlamydospora TaxID=158046 RepID=A0A0G2DZB9_PHACM|nr:putative benzoate 4-monooxygenase cytochrome p450 [Phaeomoniella chlamydospora]
MSILDLTEFKFALIVKQAFTSPLAAVPNAGILAPFSRLLWAFPQEYFGNITLDLPRLHEKLGPLIRTGPREVSFYSLDIYDAVHKVGSKYVKDPRTYGEFVQGGHPALFSITDNEEHSRRRRLMGQLYNRTKMDNLHVMMLDEVENFVRALKGKAQRRLELIAACRALEADIISRFSFGAPIGAVVSFSRDKPLEMVAANDEKAKWMPVLVTFPRLVALWERLEQAVFNVIGWQTNFTAAMKDWEFWASNGLSIALSPKLENSVSPSLIQTLIKSGLHPQTALCEARENIGPGTDTTSATLAHILWALAHNPLYQNALRQELAELKFPTDMSSLESIPKLKACVKEGVRWAGAAAAMLPRIVPAEGVTLEGKFIPGGTTITSSPIWYLRDKTAFPNPSYYNPYRWLTVDGTAISEDQPLRDKYYIPFSKGPNICMGAHFSYYELYLSVSQVLKHFRITLPSGSHPSPSVSLYSTDIAQFIPVDLPKRKEWVAAVPTENLDVVLEEI